MKASRSLSFIFFLIGVIFFASFLVNTARGELPCPAWTAEPFENIVLPEPCDAEPGFIDIVQFGMNIAGFPSDPGGRMLVGYIQVREAIPQRPKNFTLYTISVDKDVDGNWDFNLRVSYDPDPSHGNVFGWHLFVDSLTPGDASHGPLEDFIIGHHTIIFRVPVELIGGLPLEPVLPPDDQLHDAIISIVRKEGPKMGHFMHARAHAYTEGGGDDSQVFPVPWADSTLTFFDAFVIEDERDIAWFKVENPSPFTIRDLRLTYTYGESTKGWSGCKGKETKWEEGVRVPGYPRGYSFRCPEDSGLLKPPPPSWSSERRILYAEDLGPGEVYAPQIAWNRLPSSTKFFEKQIEYKLREWTGPCKIFRDPTNPTKECTFIVELEDYQTIFLVTQDSYGHPVAAVSPDLQTFPSPPRINLDYGVCDWTFETGYRFNCRFESDLSLVGRAHIDIEAAEHTAYIGKPVTYTVRVTNGFDFPITDASLYLIPAILREIPDSDPILILDEPVNCGGEPILYLPEDLYDPDFPSCVITLGTLEPGQTVSRTITLKYQGCGVGWGPEEICELGPEELILLSAELGGEGPQESSVSARSVGFSHILLRPSILPTLNLKLESSPFEIRPGETLTYTIEYENLTDETYGDIVLTAPIPQYTTYVDGSASAIGGVMPIYNPALHRLEWDLDTVPPRVKEKGTFQVKVDSCTPMEVSSIIGQAEIWVGEEFLDRKTFTTFLEIIGLTLEVEESYAYAGDIIHYTIKVKNLRSCQGPELTLIAPIPNLKEGVTFDSAEPEGVFDGYEVVWQIPSLLPDEEVLFKLNIKVPVPVEDLWKIENQVRISFLGREQDSNEVETVIRHFVTKLEIEQVRVWPCGEEKVLVDPKIITVYGKTVVHISAHVKDLWGDPIDNIMVKFSSDHGTFDPYVATTDSDGKVTTKFTYSGTDKLGEISYIDISPTAALPTGWYESHYVPINAYPPSLQIKATFSKLFKEVASETIKIPVKDNLYSLIERYQTRIPCGPIRQILLIPYPCRGPTLVRIEPEVKEFIYEVIIGKGWSLTPGPLNNILTSAGALLQPAGIQLYPWKWYVCHQYQYQIVCGVPDKMNVVGYQGPLFKGLKKIINTEPWLLNGFCYKEIKLLIGFHHVVAVYPEGEDWSKGIVLDPWITQSPEIYWATSWLFFTGSEEKHPSACVEPPEVPQAEVPQGPQVSGFPHSDIAILITDPDGNRLGILPDGTFVNEMAGALGFINTEEPKFYYFWLPSSDTVYETTITGVEAGIFDLLVLFPPTESNLAIVRHYTNVSITEGEQAEIILDPLHPEVPIIFSDGTEIWSDEYQPAIQGDLDHDNDIDRNDLRILLGYRNQSASNCPECDIDEDGRITVLDARKLVLMCTRPRCATEWVE